MNEYQERLNQIKLFLSDNGLEALFCAGRVALHGLPAVRRHISILPRPKGLVLYS